MSHYQHLSIEEREKILILLTEKKKVCEIALLLNRNRSTIWREIKRNRKSKKEYSAIEAQKKYYKRRKKSRRKKLLEDEVLKRRVERLFLEEQWSPEQISERLACEDKRKVISCNTIYRAIYKRMFDSPEQKQSRSRKGARWKLRRRGKPRRRRGSKETRGKIVISNRLHERPAEADERKVIGHWEADTLLGKLDDSCLVTITDRCSRYLLAEKIEKKASALLSEKMIAIFSEISPEHVKSVTPDRGMEFAKHADVTQALNGVQFYFPNPGSPWQRGTNENTNGLLREYFPKSFVFSACTDDEISCCIDKLNKRPRKCLNWKSPFEVFHNALLHLT